jgi:hypothetical protein
MDEKPMAKQKKALEKKIAKVKKAKEKNEKAYKKYREKSKQQVVKAFVTFQSMEGKMRLLHLYNVSKWRRCCGKKAIQDRYFQGKFLDIRQPTDPSLILWENLGVGRTQRCMRILLVTLISLLLMILSFVIIIYSKNYEASLRDNFGTGSCPNFEISLLDAYEDQQAEAGERTGLMHCYCKEQYRDIRFDVRDIEFPNGENYCADWLYDYSVNNALIWAMVLVMSMINVMLKVAMRIISAFERRHDKTDLVISNTFKMFAVQFCNTAIIILLVNAQLDFVPGWFPIFNGAYDDFTVDWYKQIGVSIILTMMIGIVSPHLANSMFWMKGA